MGHGVNRSKGDLAINYVCEVGKADLYTVRITDYCISRTDNLLAFVLT